MRKLILVASLLLGACAHAPPPPPSPRVQMLLKCSAACAPAEVVEAELTVDPLNEYWQCLCRGTGAAVNPGT